MDLLEDAVEYVNNFRMVIAVFGRASWLPLSLASSRPCLIHEGNLKENSLEIRAYSRPGTGKKWQYIAPCQRRMENKPLSNNGEASQGLKKAKVSRVVPKSNPNGTVAAHGPLVIISLCH